MILVQQLPYKLIRVPYHFQGPLRDRKGTEAGTSQGDDAGVSLELK